MRFGKTFSSHALLVAAVLSLTACSDDGEGDGDGGGGGGGGGGDVGIGKDPKDGRVSAYETEGDGSCSFGPPVGSKFVAALSSSEFLGSAVCGACAEVSGPNGKVVARVVDICTACEPDQMLISQEAFAKVASGVDVRMSWRLVACQVEGPISYHIKDGSGPYSYFALQVRNHKVPIKSLEVMRGSNWETLTRENYNYFVGNALGFPPLQVRVTATTGEVLEDTLNSIDGDVLQPGKAQFK
ncbi:expansin EXLX1 family cellulose-binding protein [Stigmatella sp. ncwal1]|uniref:Expansin EXLX1 family cellulose-binding protein n=1 Tax=Stigmatella ashevillensis TaxID=2995309 RepID=A0ABT5DBZ1_9BACT|nr:expansin EXLX1 family cellulose-binding protein [Stigmatella ashevillena]MDC0710600.1 expansin EXLX1 family cellulose-binding protein [Stigmatella ashevillena]